jgi:hypothetical protein
MADGQQQHHRSGGRLAQSRGLQECVIVVS